MRHLRPWGSPPYLSPPVTPLPSGLPPAAAGLESSSPGPPRAGSPPVGEIREISGQSSVVPISPYPWATLTSREALARSCSVGHFYSSKAIKKK